MTNLQINGLPDETKAYVGQLKLIGFSDNQILGLFFVFGVLIAAPESEQEKNENRAAVLKLAPFDEVMPLDEFIGPRWVPQEIVFEELLHWLPLEIDFRQIEIDNLATRRLLTPQSHNLFKNVNAEIATMADAHRLYLDFYEVLGIRMREMSTDMSDALPSGVFQMQLFHLTDPNATREIISVLGGLMSPILKALRDFGMSGTPGRLCKQLHTQIALQGLWGGLDELFMSVAWPFQSWLFFKDGDQLPGIEELSHQEFWAHSCEHGRRLLMEHFDSIPRLSETSVKLDALPSWGSEGFSFEAVNQFIKSVWGYDESIEAHYTDVLHYRACLIHCIYSAICKETETIH